MAFVAAICPACGGQLQLDDSLEKGFCQYCGTQIIVQDAIHRVKIDGSVKVEGISTIEARIENAHAYVKIGKPALAHEILISLTKEYTSDYRPWWEYAKIYLFYSNFYSENVYIDTVGTNEAYRAAIELANEDQRAAIEHDYHEYINRIETANRETQKRLSYMISSKDFSYLNHLQREETLTFWRDRSSPIRTLDRSIVGYEIINGKLYKYEPVKQGEDSSARYTGEFHFRMVGSITPDGSIKPPNSNDIFSLEHHKLALISDESVVFAEAINNLEYLMETAYTKTTDTPPVLMSSINKFLSGINPQTPMKSSGGCYIATAVYGSYDAPEVMVLRHYRDTVLAETWYGRAFIKAYYFCSPPIANWMKDATRVNGIVRRWLNSIVNKLQEI